MARQRGLEFGVFDQTPPKTGSSARPYGPHRSILFPPQNYHSQSIGSALRASPIASFGANARKHIPNVGSALRGFAFGASQMPRSPLICPFDVRLAVSDMLRSTPTTLSVLSCIYRVAQKSKPLPNKQKIVLKPVNEIYSIIRFIRQIKVRIEHNNIIR